MHSERSLWSAAHGVIRAQFVEWSTVCVQSVGCGVQHAVHLGRYTHTHTHTHSHTHTHTHLRDLKLPRTRTTYSARSLPTMRDTSGLLWGSHSTCVCYVCVCVFPCQSLRALHAPYVCNLTALSTHKCTSIYLGLARTLYIRLIYGIFGREITKYTVIYGVYIRFWPTLHILWKRVSSPSF